MPQKKQKDTERSVNAYNNRWMKITPASKEDIAAAEAYLEVAFPEDLVKLFKLCSGGRPVKNYYISYENDIEVSIGYILPFKKESKRWDILTEYDYLYTRFNFPAELIPFAIDEGHANYYCLKMETGEVIYYLHDEPENREKNFLIPFQFF